MEVKNFSDYKFLAAIPAVLSKNPTNKVILQDNNGASVGRSLFSAKIYLVLRHCFPFPSGLNEKSKEGNNLKNRNELEIKKIEKSK